MLPIFIKIIATKFTKVTTGKFGKNKDFCMKIRFELQITLFRDIILNIHNIFHLYSTIF